MADPAPGAAEQLAAGLGAASAYADPARAFADPMVDAVVIAAPARFHADLIIAAAEAGKSVFCEKPAALSQGDLDRANDAVRAVGVVLQVGFNRRFLPEWVAACALIDAILWLGRGSSAVGWCAGARRGQAWSVGAAWSGGLTAAARRRDRPGWRNPAVLSPPAGHRVTSSRPGKARLSAP